jgi:hypothetical protein
MRIKKVYLESWEEVNRNVTGATKSPLFRNFGQENQKALGGSKFKIDKAPAKGYILAVILENSSKDQGA